MQKELDFLWRFKRIKVRKILKNMKLDIEYYSPCTIVIQMKNTYLKTKNVSYLCGASFWFFSELIEEHSSGEEMVS